MPYAFREALAALKRAPLLVLVSVLSVALSLFVVGLFGLTAFNIQSALAEVEERVEVVAYLRDGVTPEQLGVAERELRSLPEVQEVRYVSKVEALATAVIELPEFRDVFSGIDVNPLPASFEIRLRQGYRTPDTIERLAQHVLTYPFVEDASFGREWVGKIVALRRIAGAATLMIGGAFAAVAGIIIATAVRIAVFARRDEIEIMRLVGATDGFIRAPFLIEGALAGLVGGVIAVLLTFAAFEMVDTTLMQLVWLPSAWVIGTVFAGAAYGLLASAVAVRRHLGAAAILLALLAFAGDAGAQEAGDRDIVDSRRRLEEIQAERDVLREEMTRIRSRVTDLSTELSNIDRQVGAASGLVEELDFQVVERERQIERNAVELLHARDQLAERRAVLHRRLRDIYKRGALGSVEVLLAAESFSDLINRYKYLHVIAQHDRRLAQEVGNLEAQLVARERALRGNLTQLESVRRERAEEHDLLAALQVQQRQALTSVRSRESVAAQRIDQLERDEASLATMLAALERRRREEEGAGGGGVALSPTVATLSAERMGRLEWPLEGPIVYGFGRVTLPNGTAVRRNGVAIAGAVGGPVRAVEGGVVALAGPFEGYGPTVIVSHGGGYYSLYLYLREVGVNVGDEVLRGQTVGVVGGQPAGETPYVEFQIRVPGGQAVDPLSWLRPR